MSSSVFRRNMILISLGILALGAVGLAGFWHPAAPDAAMQSFLPAVTLPTVVVAGIVDGINPCAFTVLLLFVTALLTTLKAGETNITQQRARLFGMGSIYIGAVFLTYLILGVGLLKASDFFTREHLPARMAHWWRYCLGCGWQKTISCPIGAGNCKPRPALERLQGKLRKKQRFLH